MEIAKYFASLSVKIQNSDIKSVDAFLNNIGKGLKTNTKSTDTLEKAVKKETKTTVDGAKSKVSAQKAVNKETAAAVVVTNKLTQAVTNQQKVIRRNAESINKLFPAMGRSPLPARSRDRADAVSIYKDMFKAADVRIKDLNKLANKVREEGNLLGRIGRNSPHFANLPNMNKMREVTALGRIGKNAQAFSSYGKVGSYQSVKAQRISGEVSALGRIGRNSSTYGAPTRGTLQERLAAFRSNRVEGVQVQSQIEASERRILDLKRREDSRRLTHQQTVERMALRHEQKLAEIREKNAVKLSRVAKPRVSSGGGYNPTHNLAHASGHVFSDRFNLGYGVLPPQLLAALAPVAGAVAVQQGSVALGNNQALRERQRVQLDIASGANNRAARDAANAKFFALSNQLGIEAEPMVDPYAKFMKQMTSMGNTPEVAFDVYKNMSLATRAAGGGQVQMERQAYALQQIMGLGWAQSDELNRQLVDANPSIKKYIIDEYVAKTGKPRNTFEKAIANREITTDIITSAYQTAAVAGQGRVQEFSSTVQAEQARLANLMLEEQMARTLTDEVLPSMREYVKAQTEMYEAMKPFRDSLYEASASVLSFSAAALNFAAPYTAQAGQLTRNNPTLKSITTNPAWFIPDNPVTMALKYGIIGKDAYNAYTAEPAPTQKGIDFLRQSKEGFMQGGQTQVMVQPGAFVIHTQASDPEEVGKLTTQWFKTQLELTLQANPQKE